VTGQEVTYMKFLSPVLLSIGALALAGTAAAGHGAAAPPPQGAPAVQGCPGMAPPGAQQAPPGAEQAQPGPQQQAEPVGVARVFGAALQDVCLDQTDQMFADRILAEMGQRAAFVHAAKGELMLALADALESGQVNECDLQPKIEQFVAASAAAGPYIGANLSQLHGILDDNQRGAVADALAAGLQERADAHASGAWLEELTKLLNLTPDQQKAIGDTLAGFDEELAAEQEQQANAVDQFRGPAFIPSVAMPPGTIAQNAQARAARMVALTNALNEILTPEQRQIAANALREKVQG
jgi:hypothetical protein